MNSSLIEDVPEEEGRTGIRSQPLSVLLQLLYLDSPSRLTLNIKIDLAALVLFCLIACIARFADGINGNIHGRVVGSCDRNDEIVLSSIEGGWVT